MSIGWDTCEMVCIDRFKVFCYVLMSYANQLTDLRFEEHPFTTPPPLPSSFPSTNPTSFPRKQKTNYHIGRFKTKAGRDLAIGRSGEVLRAAGSSLAVAVVRGRNELVSEDDDDGCVSNFLLALPPGRSVADILKEVCNLIVLAGGAPWSLFSIVPDHQRARDWSFLWGRGGYWSVCVSPPQDRRIDTLLFLL